MQQFELERNGSSHEMLRFPSAESEHVGDEESAQNTTGVSPVLNISNALIGIGNVVRISLTRKTQRHFLNSLCHITVTPKFVYFTKTKSGGIPNMTSTSSVCVQEINTNSQGI